MKDGNYFKERKILSRNGLRKKIQKLLNFFLFVLIMVEKKNQNKYLIPILVVCIGLLSLSLIFLFYNKLPSNGTGNIILDLIATESLSCYEVQVPYEEVEEYQETIPYTDKECEEKVLVYNRGKFNMVSSICNKKVEECNKYILGICTDKTIYCTDRTILCSLELNNLDDEKGVWKVGFNFYKSGSSVIEDTSFQNRLLDPHSSGEARGEGNILSKELYETPYSCSYTIIEEPTKQVCRDVIKYKEVKKTRIITKYRTEQKCN